MMRPSNVEILMGYSIGISKSYFKPTEKVLFKDCLKTADLLTINEKYKLKNKSKILQIKLFLISIYS